MSAGQGCSLDSPGYPCHPCRFKTSQELFEAKVRKSVEECTSSALATGGRSTTAEGSASEQEIQLSEGQWSQAMKAAMEIAVAEKQVSVTTPTTIWAVGHSSWPRLLPPR